MKRYVVTLEKDERDDLAGITPGSHQSEGAHDSLNSDEGESSTGGPLPRSCASVRARVKKRFVAEAAVGGRQGRRSRRAQGRRRVRARLVALSRRADRSGRCGCWRIVLLGHDSVSHDGAAGPKKKRRGGGSAG